MALEGVKTGDGKEENNTGQDTGENKTNGTSLQQQDSNRNAANTNNKQIDPSTSFLRAARAGQLQIVKELIESQQIKNINTCNSNGLNALHLAAKEGHVDVVQELLTRGATVDASTMKGNTALHIAALAGQESAVRALLAAGAHSDAQSNAGFTPLYMAAQEGHAGCVKMLLAQGASQALATGDGFTPLAVAMQQGHDSVVAELLEADTRGKVRLPALHIAAKKDDVKAATLLLENDHNPDACSKSGFTPLHIAAHYGNTAVAAVLRSRGADVNHAAKHSITPLHVASKWGQANMVDFLIDNGANINAVTRDGLTPLHCAARSGHTPVVSRLLQQGAPIACKTKNGLTPLHMSVQGEHVEVARALLASGAPIDDVTVDYLTALHVAAHCGHTKVAKLLLDKNADANARALNGFTPLHIACKKNRLRVVELLLKYGANISATTESGLTPLHVAAFMGCLNVAIHLVQAGAPADRPTARGETPLHLAARAQQTDLIRVLLRNGAQVDARAREEQTALHVAARLGHADIASLLLQHGATVEARTKDQYTPLHIAAKEGKEEVAAILLENGAQVSSETRKGFTPLHLAAKYGRAGVARSLLKAGAEPDAKGKNNITPLHMATYYGHPDIALLLLDKGASPHSLAKNGHTALHVACRHNHPDIAFALLEHGADPCVKSKAGFTALHMAAQEGHTDCVEMLLDRQASVNDQANNGLTPLHLAAQEGRQAAASSLLGAGANTEARTHDGYTPLHVASHFGQHALVKMLLDKGADVGAATSIGYTPLHQAAQQGHTLVIHILLKHKADPNAVTINGQTACGVADRLGYIGVVEALRPVTEHTVSQVAGDTGSGPEGRYRVAAPELMQDTFMSDSEDEGGDVECLAQQQQQYRYMREAERPREMPDNVPLLQASSNNVNIDREPLHIGFLASFIVDARGGAMRSARRAGLAVVAPAGAVAQPTRVTCRAARRTLPHPPPLMEGEALAARPLQLAPPQATFLSPVVIEVPSFTTQCKERELVILRSDTGETWQDHYLHNNDNQMIQEALAKEKLEGDPNSKIAKILTCDFPQYFAVVSRIKQEMHIIGPEGGTISSSAIPQVQALFPASALTKRIRVGLQAQAAPQALVQRILGRGGSASPVLTVEPRRRKFHRSITLTMPLPPTATQSQGGTSTGSTLRLLCSIMGGQASAVWEDVTGSTPLTQVGDCVSFTTTVSARFWLMDCRNITDATKMATELYKEMLLVPFEARIVVLGKRIDALEGRLLILCLTDQQLGKTLLEQEHYTELAQSAPITLLDTRTLYLEFSGNLLPVTKPGNQLNFKFESFKDNRCEFSVRVKDPEDMAAGRIYFMSEPKASRGEVSVTASCALDVQLPRTVAPRPAKSQLDCLNLDQSGFDALREDISGHWGDSLGRHGHFSLPRHIAEDSEDDERKYDGKADKPIKDLLNKEAKANGQITVIQNGDSDHNSKKAPKKPVRQSLEIFDSDDEKPPVEKVEKKKTPTPKDLPTGREKHPTPPAKEKSKSPSPVKDKSKSPSTNKEKSKSPSPAKEKTPDIVKDTPKKDKSPGLDSDKESSPPLVLEDKSAKEKSPSPPKLIQEDLLDKVEDMFGTLAQPKKKVEIDNDDEVYNTKLVIDEDIKTDLEERVAEFNKDLQGPREEVHEVFYKTEKKAGQRMDNILDATEDKMTDLSSIMDERFKEGSHKMHDFSDNIQKEYKMDDMIIGFQKDVGSAKDNIEDSFETLKKDLPEKVDKKYLEFSESMEDRYIKAEGELESMKQKLLLEAQEKALRKDFNEFAEQKKDDLSKQYDDLSEGFNDRTQEMSQKVDDYSNDFSQDVLKRYDDISASITEREDDFAQKLDQFATEKSEDLSRTFDNLTFDLSERGKEVNKKFDEIAGNVDEKESELAQRFDELSVDLSDKRGQIENELSDKANELVHNFGEQRNEVGSLLDEMTEEFTTDLRNTENQLDTKYDELTKGLSDKKDDVEKQFDLLTSDVVDTKNDVKVKFNDKVSEVQDGAKQLSEAVQSEVSNKSKEAEEQLNKATEEGQKAVDATIAEAKNIADKFVAGGFMKQSPNKGGKKKGNKKRH